MKIKQINIYLSLLFSILNCISLMGLPDNATILLFNGWIWHLPGGGSNHFLYFHSEYSKNSKKYQTELLSGEHTFVEAESKRLNLPYNTFRFPLTESEALKLCVSKNIDVVTFPRWQDFITLKKVSEKRPLKLVLVQQGTVGEDLKNNIVALKGIDGVVGHNQEIADYFIWANQYYDLGIKKIANIAACWNEDRISQSLKKVDPNEDRESFFKRRFNIKVDNETPIICTIANMADPVKNQQLLLNALYTIIITHKTPVYAFFAGEGHLRKALEQQARDLQIDKYVFFLGSIPDAPLLLYYSDLHVLPSSAEGFPVVNIEASFMGKPIITAANTGGALLVENNKTGLTFNNNDATDLSEKIEKIINNASLQKQLGRNAADYVANTYLNKHLFKLWDDFFADL